MERTIVDFSLGSSFIKDFIYIGYALMVIGVLCVWLAPLFFLVSLFGAYLAFSRSGALVDPTRGRFRRYSGPLGWFKSEWELTTANSNVTVLRDRPETTTYGMLLRMPEVTVSVRTLAIWLVDTSSNQRTRFLEYHSSQQANSDVAKLASLLNIPVSLFEQRPPISRRR